MEFEASCITVASLCFVAWLCCGIAEYGTCGVEY